MSPFQLFVTALCSWIVREQDGVIAFLREENRVLRGTCAGDACNSVMRNGDVWLGSDTDWEMPRWPPWLKTSARRQLAVPAENRVCRGDGRHLLASDLFTSVARALRGSVIHAMALPTEVERRPMGPDKRSPRRGVFSSFAA